MVLPFLFNIMHDLALVFDLPIHSFAAISRGFGDSRCGESLLVMFAIVDMIERKQQKICRAAAKVVTMQLSHFVFSR